MIVCFDDFELDIERLALMRAGDPVRSDPMVLRVLRVLLESPGQLVTKSALMARVWERRAMSASILSVSIARLRKTLCHARGTREFVVSVPGRSRRWPMRPRVAAARAPSCRWADRP
jgi:DNA-binding winged helix-turn-helix (wHTH) protein